MIVYRAHSPVWWGKKETGRGIPLHFHKYWITTWQCQRDRVCIWEGDPFVIRGVGVDFINLITLIHCC